MGTYVQLNDREALEDLRTYWQKLAVHLKARTGLDFSLLIRRIDVEMRSFELAANLKDVATACAT